MKNSLSSYGIAFAGVFLFSLKPIFVKLAYQFNVDTTTLMALRMAFSLPIYLVIGIYTFRQRLSAFSTIQTPIPQIMAVGLLGYHVAAFILVTSGMVWIGRT